MYSFCYLNDGTNEICIDTTVEVKVGWEFVPQYKIYTGVGTSGTGTSTQYYYNQRVKLYGSADALIVPKFIIDLLYSNTITAELSSFKSYLFGELLYFEDHTLCLNAGWATDAI